MSACLILATKPMPTAPWPGALGSAPAKISTKVSWALQPGRPRAPCMKPAHSWRCTARPAMPFCVRGTGHGPAPCRKGQRRNTAPRPCWILHAGMRAGCNGPRERWSFSRAARRKSRTVPAVWAVPRLRIPRPTGAACAVWGWCWPCWRWLPCWGLPCMAFLGAPLLSRTARATAQPILTRRLRPICKRCAKRNRMFRHGWRCPAGKASWCMPETAKRKILPAGRRIRRFRPETASFSCRRAAHPMRTKCSRPCGTTRALRCTAQGACIAARCLPCIITMKPMAFPPCSTRALARTRRFGSLQSA